MSVQDEARAFMRANDQSPVAAAFAFGNGGLGGEFTLDDGRSFRLTRAVCRALPRGYPKWKLADAHPLSTQPEGDRNG